MKKKVHCPFFVTVDSVSGMWMVFSWEGRRWLPTDGGNLIAWKKEVVK